MQMYKRELYLQQLRPMYDSDLIKVIMGVRRCGKSVLLRQIMGEIMAGGVDQDHIIYLDFEDYANAKYTDTEAFYHYLMGKIIDKQKYYLFLDEIQQVKNFEKVVASVRATENVSIFITGSNSSLLAGELATLLAGRYVSCMILPLTFRELIEMRRDPTENIERVFEEYLYWGGMPRIVTSEAAIEKKLYVQDLYNTIALRDVIERGEVKNAAMLSRINQLLLTNLGKTISANTITRYLKNEQVRVAPDTVLQYIANLNKAMLFNKISRYDIKGKMVLRTLEKQYLADLCFLRLRTRQTEENPAGRLENIVYNELLSRHYQVYIGKTERDGEVDFAARSIEGEWYFYQVSVSLREESARAREFGAFTGLKDEENKYVLSLDREDYSQGDIKHINIIDWLMRPEERKYC